MKQHVLQAVEWTHRTLKAAGSPYACVSYQIWHHDGPTDQNSSSSTTTTSLINGGSGDSTQPAVHSTLCIASGLSACRFMWYFVAPASHGEDAPPGVHKTFLGVPLASTTQGTKQVNSGSCCVPLDRHTTPTPAGTAAICSSAAPGTTAKPHLSHHKASNGLSKQPNNGHKRSKPAKKKVQSVTGSSGQPVHEIHATHTTWSRRHNHVVIISSRSSSVVRNQHGSGCHRSSK